VTTKATHPFFAAPPPIDSLLLKEKELPKYSYLKNSKDEGRLRGIFSSASDL
jgi:hypothetical protein